MPWGETIADYVRTKQERKAKSRNDMWAKLMDAATMGKDIWTTISGRQYATGEREKAEANTRNQNLSNFALSSAERAKVAAGEANQRLYGDAAAMERQKLANKGLLDVAKEKAGTDKDTRASQMMSALNDSLEMATKIGSQYVITDPVTGKPSINPETMNDLIDSVLIGIEAFNPKPEEIEWAKRFLMSNIAKKSAGMGTGDQKLQAIQNPVFNPPPEKKPTKPQFADITSLAQKLVEARRAAGNDPDTKRVLDYIQGQMPRAGMPGGPDYTKNSIEWTAKAMETINKILGIAVPSTGLQRTLEVNPGARKR